MTCPHSAALTATRITGAFWADRQRLMTDVAIPYMERILKDEAPGVPCSHALKNFRIAAGLEKGEFSGMVFQDSDVAKWLEAASNALAIKPDPALSARMDDIIAIIAAAQQQDGYLNTYFTLREPDKRWTNLLECHELYCAGHMMEAGVAHYEATGKTSLLDVASKLADHIVRRFGTGGEDGIPGHQEVEIGLLRLYRVTGEAAYRDMALRFLNLRGRDPAFFSRHTPPHPDTKYGDYPLDPDDTVYNQSDMPVREQDAPRGHAVRCLYMLTAMADAARLCGDEGLAAACRRMFNRITDRQMYVTGALGATATQEAFTADWHLPSDSGYGETCASVAMCFFCRAMLLLEPDGRYADILERELYNGALAGMQLDGKRYFYVNPLEVNADVSGIVPGYRHVQPQRPVWHGCACCPPNLARLMTALGRYTWTETEDTIYCHLLIGSTAALTRARVTLATEYPRRGGALFTVDPQGQGAFALAIHIPGYLTEYTAFINGEPVAETLQKGYLILRRAWRAGDQVELRFSLAPRRLYGNPRVRDCAGRVAVARGPILYCVEGQDNRSVPLHALRLPDDAIITEAPADDPRLGDAILRMTGMIEQAGDASVGSAPPDEQPFAITAIPYYAWGNRGKNDMLLWLRR